jgi:glycosyltransferase involved in cell wall biosynthesis
MSDPRVRARLDIESIAINARYRVHQITGVQRYAHEIVNRLTGEREKSPIDLLAPASAKGAIGHLWEQTVLPAACKRRLLWSPSGSGPAFYRRQVVTFHDLFAIEHPECYSPGYARWYRHLMARLARNSLHLIAVSEYTKSRIVKLLGRNPEEITVIHNGLTTGCERVGEEKVAAARSALNLPTKRYILRVSSLEKRKNLRTTLEAWARAHESLPADTWLVLAGPVADERVYGEQDLPVGLPRVLYTGWVPEEHLAGLYSGASLFLFPSLAEGFGFPLLEAMACGLRAIVSNNSSLPEVGGDTVAYIDPLDPGSLADAIRSEMAAGAQPGRPFLPAIARARTFSWDRAASYTRMVLEAAASLSPKAHALRTSEAFESNVQVSL